MKTQENARGTALVAALGVVLVLAMVCLGAVGSVLNESSRVRHNEKDTQASYIAGGALDLFLSRVIPQPSLLREPTGEMLAGSIGPGTFAITVGQLDASTALVTAVGSHEGVSRSMRAYLRTNVFANQAQPGRAGFDKAIFADDNLEIGGTFDVVGGGVHTNANATLKGNAYGIDGDLSAVGTISGSTGKVAGTATPGADRLEFPVLDIQYYCDIAVANGEVIEVAGTFNLGSLPNPYRPRGGVLWIKGGARINAGTRFEGCLIVAGNLTINGRGITQSQRDDISIPLPGIIVYGGELKCNGTAYTQGLVYCPDNNALINGTWNGVGAVYARGTITGTGTGEVVYDPTFLDFSSSDGDAGDDVIREVARLLAIER